MILVGDNDNARLYVSHDDGYSFIEYTTSPSGDGIETIAEWYIGLGGGSVAKLNVLDI